MVGFSRRHQMEFVHAIRMHQMGFQTITQVEKAGLGTPASEIKARPSRDHFFSFMPMMKPSHGVSLVKLSRDLRLANHFLPLNVC